MPPQDEIQIQLPITWQEKSNRACGQRGMKKMPGGVPETHLLALISISSTGNILYGISRISEPMKQVFFFSCVIFKKMYLSLKINGMRKRLSTRTNFSAEAKPYNPL